METKTILDLQHLMRTGEQTAQTLCNYYLQRIDQIDKHGPTINSIIELNPDAMQIAAQLDAERKSGKTRGPLHGIPILIKDNIDTHDRMQTTAGSLALAGSIAKRDAFIVRRLRAAGAVLLGKTNLSEWANFRDHHSTSGWSSRGGLTRNPYALNRTACGSSSGSGAAVAADLCAAAVGTETDGSIICPSSANGIVGIKPTLGLLSRSGIIPIAHSQDTPGPMARSVTDAAILLGAMTGADPRDVSTLAGKTHMQKDYTPALDLAGLKDARIGVVRNMCDPQPKVMAIFEASLRMLKEAGAMVIDPLELPNLHSLGESEGKVLHHEFKEDLNAYLAGLGRHAPVHSIAEVIAFNEANAATVLPHFGQEHMLVAQATGVSTRKAYRAALAHNLRVSRKEGIDRVMRQHKLAALVVPSGGPAWQIDLVNGDCSSWDGSSSSPAAVAGYPHITVPAGYVHGLPVGLSFFGRAWQEATLIKLAYAFEQITQVRQPPQFLAWV